jgi:hypothetical protein
MSTVILPPEIDYTESLVKLPSSAISYDINLAPTNGSIFDCNAGQEIIFDLPPRSGFMVNDSMSIRYKGTVVSGNFTKIRGTPVYAPFARSTCYAGSNLLETIPDYNVTMNMLVNATYDIADKLSALSAYGWKVEGDTAIMTLESCDGRTLSTNESYCYAAPLPNILSKAKRMCPNGLMGPLRIILTLDSLASVFAAAGGGTVFNAETGTPFSNGNVFPTSFSLSDVVINYSMVDYGEAVNQEIVRRNNGLIEIKSQSFTSSSQVIPLGTSGNVEFLYNHNLQSLKSCFVHISGTSANGKFDAYDPTANNVGTELQLNIAGKLYPTRPIITNVANKQVWMLELRKALGSLFDHKNGCSINLGEFKCVGTASTTHSPSKVYFGINTEVLPSSQSVLMSGASTQNSPINLRMNIQVATPTTLNCTLISAHDAIIVVDCLSRSVTVRR